MGQLTDELKQILGQFEKKKGELPVAISVPPNMFDLYDTELNPVKMVGEKDNGFIMFNGVRLIRNITLPMDTIVYHCEDKLYVICGNRSFIIPKDIVFPTVMKVELEKP